MLNTAKLSLVSFVSGEEVLTKDFLQLIYDLRQIYQVDAYVFVDFFTKIDNSLDVKQIISPFTTKYLRIKQFLTFSKMNYCLFVDNDITPSSHEIIKLIREAIASNSDLAWGRIDVIPQSFMAQIIKIDKMLSHLIIRPFLWRIGLGISIPGQIFLVKSHSFRRNLPQSDTFFDDLTIGLYAKENQLKPYFTKATLGWEKPKSTLSTLFKQRRRWAIGFSQVLNQNRNNNSNLAFIIIHGAAYHLPLILYWILIFCLFFFSLKYSLFMWLALIVLLTFGQVSLVLASLAYTIEFLALHVAWFSVAIPRCFRWID